MTARDSAHNVSSSAERMPARPRSTWRGLVLRGGRATKYKGIAGGVSPQSVNFISMVVGAATAVIGSRRSLLMATSAAPMIEDCPRPAPERRAGRNPKGKDAAQPFFAVLPGILAASLALGASAQTPNVTVTGSTGQWSTGCTSIAVVPGACFTMGALTNPNAPTWTFKPALTSGVAIGTNGSNSDSGPTASGEVSITGGGVAETDEIYLGFEANTSGAAMISGPGSKWTADATTIVGHYGNGSLQVLDGGLFNSPSSSEVYVGYEPTGVGTVTVSGVNAATGDRSSLTAANNIYLGYSGSGTLNILAGGFVSSKFTMYVGQMQSGSGLVEVSGVDAATRDRSTLQVINNQMWVGNFGQGRLHVLDGGLVEVDQGIGFGSDVGSQGYGTVDGIDPTTGIRSEIDATDVYVGLGNQGKLRITNGGLVAASSDVFIGDNPGAVGVLTVDGVDAGSGTPSTLTTNNLYVGYDGTGTLNIVNGGVVSNGSSYVGIISLNTTSPGTINVSGNDGHGHASTWTMTGNLDVGENSIGSAIGIGALNVSDGGQVSNDMGYIGFAATSQGTVTVSGTDSNGHASTWTNTGDLVIGQGGAGALDIEDGGEVTNNTGYIGATAGSSGTVTVSGNDGNGHASTWTNAGDLHVGDGGVAGNEGVGALTITDGGAVSNGTGYIGYGANSQGTVTVSGTDSSGHASTWTNTGDVVVGQGGTGTLLIEGGGQVTNNFGYIGVNAGSNGTVTVSGRDSNGNASTWRNAGDLHVGDDQGSGTLTITDGGVVSNAFGIIGYQPGAQGAVTVSGTDGNGHASTWTSANQVLVGDFGTGSLVVEGGGQVSSDQSLIGYDGGAVGTVTVSGIDSNGHASAWAAANNIYVGFLGTGTLTIADGGAVATSGTGGGDAAAFIGYNNGSTGTVMVSSTTANVSTLTTSDAVVVGEGGTGTLTIDKGGLVNAANDVFVADQGTATGTLNLLGDATGRGVLETGSVTKGDGSASLNLDGGILRANRDEPDFLSGFDALTVGSEGAWFDTNAHDIAVGTAFAGSSTFNKLGAGTLTLTGDSSAFTGVTTISAGTLQLGDGGATGGITGDVNDNGALAFDRSDNGLVLNGVISGSGAVGQIGTGKTTLTGDDTYTGGTTITAGTLQLGNGSTTGSIVGNVADNGVLAFDRLDNVAFDGTISGTGAVTKAGADIVTLTGNNTYTGVTTIAAGTLQLGNGGATGSIAGNIANSGTLVFNRSDDGLVLNGAISGGAVQQIGSGMTTLTGVSSYTSTTVANGTLRIEGAVTNTSGIAVTGNNASLIISGPGASFTTTGTAVNPVLGSAAGITFTVEDGGHYRNNLGFAFFAQTAGTIATLNVTGAGSSFFTDTSIGVKDGIGFFNVTDGGQIMNNSDLFLGTNNFASANGQATIVISGAGSSWKATNIAYMANATVSLLDGGLLAIGTADVGTFAGKTTNVLVSGQDSQFDVGSLNFGTAATAQAAITVADQGALVLTGGARALSIGASGTLNIGGAVGEAATGAGTIDAASVTLTGALNFNHDDSAYLFGLAISGNGGRVTQAGSGTTILTAANTYTGGTTITAGALQLGDGGTSGSITGDVADDGLLAFDRSDVVTFAGLISGSGAVSQIGSGTTILTTDETYTGGTTIAAGTLQLGNGATSGSIVGDVADNGVLAFDRLDDVAFDGVISGSGAVSQIGAGTTIFTTDETYTGGTAIAAGTLQLGNGGTSGAIVGDVADNGVLAFDRLDTLAYGGVISGAGGVHQMGAGATVLSGANSYTGQTTIDAGILRINGDQSAATGLTRVNSGGTLGGSGIIGGSVQVADGGALAPGNSPGTLTIKGDLTLASGAALDYELGQAGVAGGVLNDLVNVGGNLTLDGTLNVTPSAGGAFGAGLYRIFNYDGTLTNNGLDLGSVPAGTDLSVQTSVANQVNLVNSTGLRLNFWDGQAGGKNDSLIQGGDGVWRLADGVNSWTTMTGSLNADYAQNSFAVFTGAAGTVTIDNGGGAVSASGLQFAVDGYRLQGDALTLTGASAKIRVGDGAADGAGMTATIAADLIGTAQLTKTDLGTLVLTGTNSYAGGTAIQGGALQLGAGGSTGSILGDVANDGVLTFDRSDTVTFGGAISGMGAVRQIGGGTVILTGANTYTGTTTITAGTLQLGDGGTSGSLTGDIVNNSALAFDRLGTATYGGAISGVGSVSQIGSGTTILTGDSTYTGMTEIAAGELRVAGGGRVSGITFVSVDTGALTVTGSGSAFTTPDDLLVGRGAGAASVMVSDGGQLNTGRSFIGELGATTTSATALTATVTGAGSVWTATDGFFLGDQSGSAPVSLTVADGGVMHVQQFSSIIGNGGIALVTVTDANSRLVLDDGVNLLIGQLAGGAGTLTVTNGGIVTAPVVIMGVSDVNASGVLNINGVPGAQGVLQTTSLTKDVGSGTVNFNGGVLRASDDNGTDFIAGFNPGDITIGTGGAFIDSNGFAVTASSALAGAGALTKQGAGTLVLTAENTYAGGTTIQAGTLQLGDGGTAGSILGDVADNGVLAFDRSDDVTLGSAISGAGAVSQIGPGATILTSANTYAGGTTITAGTLQLGNGGTSGSIVGDVADNAALAFDRLDDVTFGGVISGSGAVSQIGGGATVLTGANSYAGTTTISLGSLFINGDQSAAPGLTQVLAGGVLGGTGVIGGDVTVADNAALNPGDNSSAPGTLTIKGGLSLSGASVLNYSFGQANTVGGPLNDLIKVGGDLTLGGVINVVSSPGGAFDPGLYRVISYDGTLTDHGLTIGSAPSATFDVQTAIAHQVNLVNTAGLSLNYWDGGAGLKNNGGIEGGDGVWHVGGSDSNWTTETGDLNASYANGAFAIFAAAPGVVSIDGAAGDVHTSGMQFAVNGYQLGGDPLFLDGAATIRVGDGTADGAGYVAAIGSQLSGSGGLVKTDLGTLVLTSANTYAGATSVNAGRLEINGDQSGAVGLTTVNAQGTLAGSGVVGGNVTVVDGTIAPGTSAAPGGLTIKGSLTLNAGSSLDYRLGQAGMVGGALNDLLTVGGNLTLDGTLNVTTSAGGTFGPGIYRLIDYSGTLTDNGLALGALPAGNSGSIQTSVAGQINLVDAVGATMVNFWDGPKGTSNDNVITGGDGVWRVGGSDLWAVANGSANGAFQSGVYAVFSGAAGTVTVDNSAGQVSVSGMQFATDGYKVTGGAISLDAGDAIVRVGDGTSAGAAFKAAISAELTGPGQLDKTDLGTLILTGANTYTGGTTVSSGTLQLGDGGTSGSIQGDVAVAGALAFNRSDVTTFGGVISGSGTLAQTGSGATTLTADSAAFTGQTAVRAGTLEVDGVLGGTADVAQGGRLAGTGQVGGVTNHGVIAPGRNGLGTLTIAGNYAGQGGGLEIQAQLGGDASPTDRLVVTGATSGATPVKVTNLGGQGGLTQKGIEIVQVSGASSGQFTLANGAYSLGGQAVVVAGAYGYVLQKDQSDGGWYLRSSLPGGNGGEAPLYQPGAPVYEAYANTLLSLSEAPTLRQRVGERQYDTTDTDHDGVWGRVEGTTSRLEPGISTTGVHQDIGSWKAQFGVDQMLSGSPDGTRLIGGLTAQVGTATTRTTSAYGGGDINTTAYGLGATLTWYGQQGAYVDAQAQATWFASDLSSNLVNTLAEGEHGHGYGLSVETGKAFAVRGDLSVTPQAQLSYTSAGFDDFNDRFGADIDSDKGQSLQGRLGLALDHHQSWQDATGQLRQLSVYSLVNLKYEFLDGTRVLVSGTPLDSRQGRTWAGLGGGGTYSWGNGRYSVYGQATADTTLAGFGDSFTVTATTGFRMRF